MMLLSPATIINGLNEAQQKAVSTTEGPLLIVAGPGTGKTLTIVRRIARLVQQGVPPENILAVTFTNRAAREMKERAETLIGTPAARLFIGTFHLLGLRIIRESGRKDFVVYDRDEQMEFLRSLMKASAKEARQTAERISRIKNFCGSPEEDIGTILRTYHSSLNEANACDFDDLIRMPIELLQDEGSRQRYRDRFRYIIVDEYQDINPAQYRLLRLLTPEAGNICAVGDPDQSIYSFRGADLDTFLSFETDFPGAARITLSENYRSAGRILDAAQGVIRNNRRRLDKNLSAARGKGALPAVVSVADERSEGAAIIREIEARIGGTSHSQIRQMSPGEENDGHPYRFSDFAVIYRTNKQAKALEESFSSSGIPYQVIGKRSSAQRTEIEETIAFLRRLAGEGKDRQADAGQNCEGKLLTDADFFDPRADAVTLMTMHMAKGLEFRVVFIAGCEESLVPGTFMKDGVDIEEERRLFYVGMTRAKDELFLLHARSRFLYGQSFCNNVSRFVHEIPDELKESRVIADKIKKLKPEEKQMGLF